MEPDTNFLKSSSVLVTGGAGFIGSSIVDRLLNEGCRQVIVLDNLVTGSIENIRTHLDLPNFTFIEGSITDFETCLKASEGVDFILHQAALGSVPRSIADPLTTHMVNATGFINMLNASRENKVKRLIYASSSSVYGDSKLLPKKEDQLGMPLSPYAVSKRSNELYASVFSQNYGMEIVGLRYFNIFGPRQSPKGPYAAAIPIFIQSLIDGVSPTINGDGMQSRDFTFVENAVEANILALNAGTEAVGQVFNIAAGNRIGVLELFNLLKTQFDSAIEPKFGPVRNGDVRDSFASIDLAGKFLNYYPKVSFEDGLSKTLNWFIQKEKELKNV